MNINTNMAHKQMLCRLVIVMGVICGLVNQGNTQTIDSLGRKFMFALPTPYKPSSVSGDYRPLFHIVISTPSKEVISGTITIPGVNFGQSFITSSRQLGNITVEATGYLGYNFELTPRTVTVEAGGDVSVHIAYTYSNFATEWLMGTTNVMPVEALGTKYFVASYAPYSSRKSEFTVTATDEQGPTKVDITTSNNEHYTEYLDPSQTYRLQSSVDLTGSMIIADKVVSVMAGSGCSKIPSNKERCNYLVVHLTDVDSAGTQFLLTPFKDRTSGYIFRAIAVEDNTQLSLLPGQGASNTTEIHAGQFYEIDVADDTVWYISSSAPILVFKYGKGGTSSDSDGDPIMVIVPAVSHFIPEVTFPVAYLPTRRESQYSISITIECELVDGLVLDGNVQGFPTDVLSSPTSLCVVRLPIATGIHTVAHTSADALFAVVVHAISYKIGYTYQAGYNVKSRVVTDQAVLDNVPGYLGDDGLGLVCGTNEMIVYVNKSLLFDGDARDIHFIDPVCSGQTINGTIIRVVAPYKSCGTVQEEEDQTSMYKNKLIYTGPRFPGPIIRDPTFDIPVTCSHNNRVLVSLALAPKSQTVNKTLDGMERLLNVTYVLQMFDSNTYNKAYIEEDFPVTVELGQSLYFQSSVSGAPNLKLMTQQCLTTKTNDPLQLPNFIFVDNGCPADDTVTLYETEANSTNRFSIQMFAFLQNEVGDLHNQAYIHCWLLACNNSDSSSRCNSDCSSSGRSQRDAVKQTNQDLSRSQHVYIRQGPIILVQQRHGDSSSVRTKIASAVGGSFAVLGVFLLIILVLFVLLKVRKQRGGSFNLRRKHTEDDTLQLIEMTSKA